MDDQLDTLTVAIGADNTASVGTGLLIREITGRAPQFDPRPAQAGPSDFINWALSNPTLTLITGLLIRPYLEGARDWIIQSSLDAVRERFRVWYERQQDRPLADPIIERVAVDIPDQIATAIRAQQRSGSPYIMSRNNVGVEIENLEGRSEIDAKIIVIEALMLIEVIAHELGARNLSPKPLNWLSDNTTSRIAIDDQGSASIGTMWGEERGGELKTCYGVLHYNAATGGVTHTECADEES